MRTNKEKEVKRKMKRVTGEMEEEQDKAEKQQKGGAYKKKEKAGRGAMQTTQITKER